MKDKQANKEPLSFSKFIEDAPLFGIDCIDELYDKYQKYLKEFKVANNG